MTTKKKCFELAKQHGIEIDYYKFRGLYSTDLSCPDGYQLEEWEGARRGLSMSGIENAKKLWKEVYSDLVTMIGYKPWHKVPNYPDACCECGESLLTTQTGDLYCPTWNCKGDPSRV